MTVDRFLAIAGPAGPERDAIVAEAAHQLELTLAFEASPLAVLVGAGTSLFELDGRGVVVGGLFLNHGVDAERLRRAAIASGGRVLVDMAWGDYVALLTEGGDVHARMVRSPSGGLHAFVARVGGLHLVASDIELILDTDAGASGVDWNFVTDHLVFPHLRGRRTGLAAVDEIFPGDAALIRDTGYERQGYWSPWRFAAGQGCHDVELVADEECQALDDDRQVAAGQCDVARHAVEPLRQGLVCLLGRVVLERGTQRVVDDARLPDPALPRQRIEGVGDVMIDVEVLTDLHGSESQVDLRGGLLEAVDARRRCGASRSIHRASIGNHGVVVLNLVVRFGLDTDVLGGRLLLDRRKALLLQSALVACGRQERTGSPARVAGCTRRAATKCRT